MTIPQNVLDRAREIAQGFFVPDGVAFQALSNSIARAIHEAILSDRSERAGEAVACEHDWFDMSNRHILPPAFSCRKCGLVKGTDDDPVYIPWPWIDAHPAPSGEIEALCERLVAWGENSPDPDYFSGDVLGSLLGECRDAATALRSEHAARVKDAAEVVGLLKALGAWIDAYPESDKDNSVDSLRGRYGSELAHAMKLTRAALLTARPDCKGGG